MSAAKGLELWGGIECTVARIGDRYRDQARETGHRDRPGDIARIASLGIRTLRYPVVWETLSSARGVPPDWRWHDDRLAEIRQAGIRPIAGLIHHGSGPAWTNLLDPAFPALLARHAGRVARRYPWIDLYTPVNEPLTTARFSALYGHWYPHLQDYGAFLRALVNQCRATVLAMRAVRRVNPAARLVATDDFGRTFATPPLQYQADHENERRWLSFDLLFGRVDRDHPWWDILQASGIGERELAFFLKREVVPDIVGVNHYLTSERFLDGRLGRYPDHLRGGNGHDVYADVEAVRVDIPSEELGPAARLREVWERYRAPVAVTEVHHGCTRDEQLRWFLEVWRAAEALRDEGADIRAVTLWSIFGTRDWNTLLTREAGIYEPGAFDARGPQPRPTALAAAARDLAATGSHDHPVLDRPGWWHRDDGRFYQPIRARGTRLAPIHPRTLLLVGSDGPLLRAFTRIAASRGLDHEVLPPAALAGRVDWTAARAWAAIDLDTGAELAPVPAGLQVAAITTARLFDGSLGRAATESDPPSPSDEPGRRAAARGARLLDARPDALLVRTGPLFGPHDRDGMPFRLLEDMAAGRELRDGGDDLLSPTYLPDLVHVVLDLLIDGETGIRHLANGGAVTAGELAGALAGRVGLSAPVMRRGPDGRNLALGTGRGDLLPPLSAALDRFVGDCEPDWHVPDGILGIAAE